MQGWLSPPPRPTSAGSRAHPAGMHAKGCMCGYAEAGTALLSACNLPAARHAWYSEAFRAACGRMLLRKQCLRWSARCTDVHRGPQAASDYEPPYSGACQHCRHQHVLPGHVLCQSCNNPEAGEAAPQSSTVRKGVIHQHPRELLCPAARARAPSTSVMMFQWLSTSRQQSCSALQSVTLPQVSLFCHSSSPAALPRTALQPETLPHPSW